MWAPEMSVGWLWPHSITNPQFELTGVCVSTPEKVGKDAGELCGVGLDSPVQTGIKAVDDLDALLATKPECVVYCAMGDTRLPDAMGDVMRILAAGVNVVGSSPGLLQYPWGVMPDKYIARVEAAAQQGNSSIFITGVDPGFINDLIPFALAGTCQRIETVRCMEIHDYASYNGAEVMHYMGFARPMDEIPMLLQPGVLSIAWGTAIRQLSAGLGIEIDEITESYQREPAPEDFDIAVGHVAKGTAGRPAVRDPRHGQRPPRGRHRAHHPVAARPAARLAAARRGRPAHTASRSPGSPRTPSTSCRPAGRATTTTRRSPAPRAGSSMPSRHVVAAPPGIRSTLDLPLVTGKGLFAPTTSWSRRTRFKTERSSLQWNDQDGSRARLR